MNVAAADELWQCAQTHIEQNEPNTLEWARSVTPASFRNLRMKRFLEAYCFVVYASGFRYATVKEAFPVITVAFKNFNSEKLARMRSIAPVLRVFGNERKAATFLQGASSL